MYYITWNHSRAHLNSPRGVFCAPWRDWRIIPFFPTWANAPTFSGSRFLMLVFNEIYQLQHTRRDNVNWTVSQLCGSKTDAICARRALALSNRRGATHAFAPSRSWLVRVSCSLHCNFQTWNIICYTWLLNENNERTNEAGSCKYAKFERERKIMKGNHACYFPRYFDTTHVWRNGL